MALIPYVFGESCVVWDCNSIHSCMVLACGEHGSVAAAGVLAGWVWKVLTARGKVEI